MQRKIYKYDLTTAHEQELNLPVGYKLLHVDLQNDKPRLWALVNPDQEATEKVAIKCYGTGQEVKDDPDLLEHIGSVLQYNGRLVWHYFLDLVNLEF